MKAVSWLLVYKELTMAFTLQQWRLHLRPQRDAITRPSEEHALRLLPKLERI